MPCLLGEVPHHDETWPDGKSLPENWKCVNTCRLIHRNEKPAQKK